MQGSARKDVVFGAARVYTVTVPGPKWKSWLKTIWGYNDNTRTRTVDVHVSRLRKKLEHRRDILIHTVVRQGYVLQLNGSGSRTQLEASVVPIREPGGAGQAYAATV